MIRDQSTKCTLFIITFFTSQSFSQNQEGTTIVTRDLESWTRMGLKYKPFKKLSTELTQHFRFSKNALVLDQSISNFDITFKVTDYLKLGLGTRYILDRDKNSEFDTDLRFNFDVKLNHKLNRFSFKYRLRYQNKNELGISIAQGDYYKNYLRLKIQSKYNIPKWKFDPVLSVELFRDLTKYTGQLDKFRTSIGTSYSFKKYGDLGIYYRIEKELNTQYSKTTNIIGLNYSYTLKRKK
jgi:hypothetical protein